MSPGDIASHFHLLANLQVGFAIRLLDQDSAAGILQNERVKPIHPGDVATNPGAHMRRSPVRIEPPNLGDGSERGVFGLPVETITGSAGEEHAESSALAKSS